MRSMYATAAAAAILIAAGGAALADNGSGPPEEAEPGSAYAHSYPQLAGGPPLAPGDRWHDKGDYSDEAYSPPPPPEEDMAPYDDAAPMDGASGGADYAAPSGYAHHYAPPPQHYAQGPEQPEGYADEGYPAEAQGEQDNGPQAHGGGQSGGAMGGWRRYEHHKGPTVRRYAWQGGGMHGRKTVKTYSYDSGWVPTHGYSESHGYGAQGGCGHGCGAMAQGHGQGHGGSDYGPPPPPDEGGYDEGQAGAMPPPEGPQGYDDRGYSGEAYDRYGGGQEQGGYGDAGYGGGMEAEGGDYHSFWKYRTGYQPCGELINSSCGGFTTAGLRVSDGMFLDGGVGPAWVGSGGGGGGVIVGGGGFGFGRARASASARAFASARARVHVSGGRKGGRGGGCCH